MFFRVASEPQYGGEQQLGAGGGRGFAGRGTSRKDQGPTCRWESSWKFLYQIFRSPSSLVPSFWCVDPLPGDIGEEITRWEVRRCIWPSRTISHTSGFQRPSERGLFHFFYQTSVLRPRQALCQAQISSCKPRQNQSWLSSSRIAGFPSTILSALWWSPLST